MRYGQATSAITRVGNGGYGGGPRVSQALARTGFSPPPSAGQVAPAHTRTGESSSANTSSTIFQGMDNAINTVPAAAPGPPVVPGTLAVTWTPCEPVVILDFELTDQSGQLLFDDIRTCRSVIYEGGFSSVNALQSASTSRRGWMAALQRLILMQTVPLRINFRNPTGNALNIAGNLLVVPIDLPQNLPQATQAAIDRFNAC